MTELHWALIVVAGVLLLALFVYGKWQEREAGADRRRDAPRRRRSAGAGATDRRSAAGRVARRIEPRLEHIRRRSCSFGAGQRRWRTKPRRSTGGAEAIERSDASAYALPDGWIEDPLLDFVIELRCAHAIDGVAALEAKGQLERLELPLATHLAVWDAKSQQWTAPDRFGFYSELLIAVQMAHATASWARSRPRVSSPAQQIALGVDADFDAPDVPRLVAQAAELDQLCARFDVQITLTVEARKGRGRRTRCRQRRTKRASLRWARAAGRRATRAASRSSR